MALGEIETTFTEYGHGAEGNPVKMFTCDSCGALVLLRSKEAHEKWHKGLPKDMRRIANAAADTARQRVYE